MAMALRGVTTWLEHGSCALMDCIWRVLPPLIAARAMVSGSSTSLSSQDSSAAGSSPLAEPQPVLPPDARQQCAQGTKVWVMHGDMYERGATVVSRPGAPVTWVRMQDDSGSLRQFHPADPRISRRL